MFALCNQTNIPEVILCSMAISFIIEPSRAGFLLKMTDWSFFLVKVESKTYLAAKVLWIKSAAKCQARLRGYLRMNTTVLICVHVPILPCFLWVLAKLKLLEGYIYEYMHRIMSLFYICGISKSNFISLLLRIETLISKPKALQAAVDYSLISATLGSILHW